MKTSPLAKKLVRIGDLKDLISDVDILLAHRYLYWCAKRPIISDRAYDVLKRELMEYGGGYKKLTRPASDRATGYRAHIRSLAFYLLYKFEIKQPKPWTTRHLPPDFFLKKNRQ